ncbi:glycosyltransferase family 2 protein [Lewinella cohaerens]|uniref:glycosyltransferase family 2 protein n=1 Tax=Lewinella cohaerens TaxID=70995 RepID=UPI00036775FA|nr:glycosyltransferase family 2 protein [Lewinella cohaerens]
METKQPILVSIIIPCYNVENYIARAIDSALAQTYLNTEIICVDNNSTDRTLEILSDYRKKYPEKIQVFHELEQGAPAARNLGVRYARGEWLQFLDADDEILPQKIEKQLVVIAIDSCSFVVSPSKLISPEGGQSIINTPECDPLFGVFMGSLGNTLSNLWCRTSLQNVGGWNNEFKACQEYELMARLVTKGFNPVWCQNVLAIVYQRHGSISYQSSAYFVFSYQLRVLYYQNIIAEPQHKAYFQKINQRFFSIIKMYSSVCPEKGIAAFKAYFPKLYPVSSPFEGGMFYLVAKFLGYRVAVWVLRVLR